MFVGGTLRIEMRNKEMNAFLACLIRKLRENGVYSLLVKGQGIAQCYERPLWRACGDIDLLLDTSNYNRAKCFLLPLAEKVEPELVSLKHQGVIIKGEVVELHGALHSRLSNRIDKEIDIVQQACLSKGEVRAWRCDDTDVFLPSPDNDIIFVFTHILFHFFVEGVGMRQICDWCRLLWTYRDSINVELLGKRLRRMALMTEWKAFAALGVEWLGMPAEAIPFYSAEKKWKRKAERIMDHVIRTGNFGNNRERVYPSSFYGRKLFSLWYKLCDYGHHMRIFPLDSAKFFCHIILDGIELATTK